MYVRRNKNFWKITCMLRQDRPSNISQMTYVLDQRWKESNAESRMNLLYGNTCDVLINLRTVIFEDTEKGLFQSLKQQKAPSFLSPSTNASFYTDLPMVLTFSVCPQNASAGHWNWRDRLGRESCCYVNSLALQKPLGTNKRRIFLVFPKICNRVCLTQ